MQVAFWFLVFHTVTVGPLESTSVISQLSISNAKQPPPPQLWHHLQGALQDSSTQV